MTEEDIKLSELLKISPSLFLNVCINKFKNGDVSEFCTYVQLKLINDNNGLFEEVSKNVFAELREKFNHIDTSLLQKEYERSKNITNSTNLKQDLKKLIIDIRNSVRNAHEKNPDDGYSGYLGFLNELVKNVNNSKGFKYDASSFSELSECYFTYKTKYYQLNENIKVKLKPGNLLHILVGHIKKYHIPRSGAAIMFSKANDWKELLLLLDKIIYFLSDELIEHFSENEVEYDNDCFEFEDFLYGIHIDRSMAIKTFYERKYKC
jgi:hypothetical protein